MSIRAALVMISVLGAAGGASAAAYTYFSRADERAERQEKAQRDQEIRFALARTLERAERPPLTSVVAGSEVSPGLWAFRAAFEENEEKFSPAYGGALLRCEADYERAECWTLAELYVNGQMRLRLSEAERARILRQSVAVAPPPRAPNPVAPAALTAQTPTPDQHEASETDKEDPVSVLDSVMGGIGAAADALREAVRGETNDNAQEKQEQASAAPQLDEEDAAEAAKEASPVIAAPVAAAENAPEAAAADSASNVEEQKEDELPPEALSAQKAEATPAEVEEPALADTGKTPVIAAQDPQKDAPAAGADAVDQAEEKTVASREEAPVQEPSAPAAPDAAPQEQAAADAEPLLDEEAPAAAEEEAAAQPLDDEQKAEGGAPAPAQEAAAQPAPATHFVRVSEVNARLSPSMRGRVLAVISAGQELRQIGRKGGWGQYELVGGDKDGQKMWIFGRLVSPK